MKKFMITIDIDGVLADTPRYHPWEPDGKKQWLKDLPNLKVRFPSLLYAITHPAPNEYFTLVSARPPTTLEATSQWLLKHSKDLPQLPIVICTGGLQRKLDAIARISPAFHIDDDPRVYKRAVVPVLYLYHPSWEQWFAERNETPPPRMNIWRELVNTLQEADDATRKASS